MPALVGPMQRYAQLGHPGALPPKDQSAGIPEACLWGLSLALSGGTLGAQWAKTPPGSHGAIAWPCRYMAGIRSSIWAYPRDRGTPGLFVDWRQLADPTPWLHAHLPALACT